MSPIVLSAAIFLILEVTHHFSPMLSYGIALGGLLTAGAMLLVPKAAPLPETRSENTGGRGESA